jgi:hypothetical protein
VLMEEVMRSIAYAYGWPDFVPPLRTLAAVAPERLARLSGAYAFDDGSIYILRNRGGRLEGQELGQAPVELFASSDQVLFARGVPLVVNFEAAGGAPTSLRHRVGETERQAHRTTDEKSRKIFAWLDSIAQRFRDQSADPRAEAAIRTLLAGISAGDPDRDSMSPALAESIGQQLQALRQWFDWLGELKGLKFQQVDANGRDEYRADFVRGPLRIQIRLNEDGRIEGAEFAPG